MSDISSRPPTPRQLPRSTYNEVWEEFLNTFHVKCIFQNQKLDVKQAIAICLKPLKKMAEAEEWGSDDIILINYFVHTFHALREAQRGEPQGRYIVEYNNWIYFDTGLITTNMESIYAAFEKNRAPGTRGTDKNPQYFIGGNPSNFLRDVHMTDYCNPLPNRCRYFDDYTQLIMDGTKTPTVQWAHIIDENWERICKVLYPGRRHDDRNFKEQQQYDAHTRLAGALNIALKRVHTNYRTAVPHSYRGELQLLLPLCILKPNKPDLVLTISRVDLNPPAPGQFSYTAKTILTLDMAYQNARLVARPEKDWLLAPKTDGE
ncbi:hypothetical protein I4U23_004263 [Adineta vaga]|nr:hypothetical protein I4U23_004263 [Adineta vaga]